MKNLIFSFLIAFSTISLAEEVTSQKEVDVYKTKKILSELPQDKIKALINVKKNILNDEINFRNRFIELRSLSNIALKENNENKYKTLMEEIGLLKDEAVEPKPEESKDETEGDLIIKDPEEPQKEEKPQEETKQEDETISKENLPATGIRKTAILAIVVIAIGIIFLIKYKNIEIKPN